MPQAEKASTTRRAIFAAAVATPLSLTLAGKVLAAPSAPGPMMALLAQRNALADWLNNHGVHTAEDEASLQPLWDRFFALQDRIMAPDPSNRDELEAQVGLYLELVGEGGDPPEPFTTPIIKAMQAFMQGSL